MERDPHFPVPQTAAVVRAAAPKTHAVAAAAKVPRLQSLLLASVVAGDVDAMVFAFILQLIAFLLQIVRCFSQLYRRWKC